MPFTTLNLEHVIKTYGPLYFFVCCLFTTALLAQNANFATEKTELDQFTQNFDVQLKSADFDGDGREDYVAWHQDRGLVFYLKQAAGYDQKLIDQGIIPQIPGYRRVEGNVKFIGTVKLRVGNFNNDDLPDIALDVNEGFDIGGPRPPRPNGCGHVKSNQVLVLLNGGFTGDQWYGPPVGEDRIRYDFDGDGIEEWSCGAHGFGVGDLNRDGLDDLVFTEGTPTQGARVTVWYSSTNGEVWEKEEERFFSGLNLPGYQEAHIVDFHRDGEGEIVILGTNQATIFSLGNARGQTNAPSDHKVVSYDNPINDVPYTNNGTLAFGNIRGSSYNEAVFSAIMVTNDGNLHHAFLLNWDDPKGDPQVHFLAEMSDRYCGPGVGNINNDEYDDVFWGPSGSVHDRGRKIRGFLGRRNLFSEAIAQNLVPELRPDLEWQLEGQRFFNWAFRKEEGKVGKKIGLATRLEGQGNPGVLLELSHCLCGDFDDDHKIGLGDALVGLNFLFLSGRMGQDMEGCTEDVNLASVLSVLNHAFQAGPPPECKP